VAFSANAIANPVRRLPEAFLDATSEPDWSAGKQTMVARIQREHQKIHHRSAPAQGFLLIQRLAISTFMPARND